MTKVLVVLSGGMDSTTLAYVMSRDGLDLELLTFDYGQRHRKEIAYASEIARMLGCVHHVFKLPLAGFLPGSSLTDSSVAVPEGHYADESMKLTVVPNRNAIFLSIAFGIAAARGFERVATAVHAGDHPVYLDCRPSFLDAFQSMELQSLGPAAPELWTPYVHSTKAQIVAEGSVYEVPYHLTWSCYKGARLHCGKCGTCVERREAFELAGVEDPTVYLQEKC